MREPERHKSPKQFFKIPQPAVTIAPMPLASQRPARDRSASRGRPRRVWTLEERVDADYPTRPGLDRRVQHVCGKRYIDDPHVRGVPLHRRDVTGDGGTDASDQAIVLGAWGTTIGNAGYLAEADLNRDGSIGSADLSIVLSYATALAPGLISNASPTGPDSTIGWDGYVLNPETRLYTVRHRSYLPVLGRWMERDPAGYVDGQNLYQAMRSRPTTDFDAFGLMCANDCGPCEDKVKQFKESDAYKKFLREYAAIKLKNPKCRPCGEPAIRCHMPAKGGKSQADKYCWGFKDSGSTGYAEMGSCPAVTLCCNRIGPREDIDSVIREELQHVADLCADLQFRMEPIENDCATCLCVEMRGARAAGKSRKDAIRDAVRSCAYSSGRCKLPDGTKPKGERGKEENEKHRKYLEDLANKWYDECISLRY